ncbi:ORF6C domain-containing protein [Liquorilactobacillus nagelii]|uniref:ORF6C domain-containing protein n=2 Tax=Liquorilactobacillus nagelii TaxID=82688 RepID=UPI00242CF3B2|nr:ORF6C domain-containing protein [Liquorilactobacillus nagelii]MCI1699438.1 ORF6C domain-containing protein [Liquorilactobacillus nagelii]
MNEIKKVEFKDELILTTGQLAVFYGVSPQRIKQNFANNKNKFVEGTHYFELSGEELKQFKSQVENIDLPINKFASHLILWTKRGASRHSKMLGTDQAWDMYDELEENYFSVTNQRPLSLPEQISLVAKGYSTLEKDVKEIKQLMGLPGNLAYKFTQERNKKIVTILGGKDTNAYGDKNLRQRTYSSLFKSFKEVFMQDRYNDTSIEKFKDAIEFTKNWYPPFELQKQINFANAQTRLGD